MSEEEKQLSVKQDKVAISMDERGIQLRSMDEMGRFCQAVARSGLAPKGLQTPEAIMVAVQHGLEVGLKPMQALQGIAVINGRPSLFGDAAMAVVTGHPDCEGIEESMEGEGENMVATCTVRRKGRLPIQRTFSVAEAKHAKLWGKAGPWTDYPKRMLQMRARSWAMRDSFADALKGIGIIEEVQDIKPARVEEPRKVNEIVLPGDEPKEVPVEVVKEKAPPKPMSMEELEKQPEIKF
jgi:hypothetical protein